MVEGNEVFHRCSELIDDLLNEENPSTLEETPALKSPLENITRVKGYIVTRKLRQGRQQVYLKLLQRGSLLMEITAQKSFLDIFKNTV